MAANYNRTTWFYDTLAKLVYGRNVIEAQVALIKLIPANSKLLIVGGGTGWIIEEIGVIHSNLQITYVEVAANMMAISQKRNVGRNGFTFINAEIESISLPQNFDVILTPFFFSNFKQAEAVSLFTHIDLQLKPGGLWLNADFQIAGKWWHRAMLKTMYLFFNLFGAVKTNVLYEVSELFMRGGYKIISAHTFYRDFIISKVFKKQT